MIKKLLSVIGMTAVGAVVVRKVRGSSVDPGASLDVQPERIPAETRGSHTVVALEAEPQPDEPLEVEPQAVRHALRPSPVPRERPQWSPPVEETGTGKHAFRAADTRGESDTAG